MGEQEALDRPSIFDALKEQLGLKLAAQRGPVQYLVIDHIERPSEN
ncbi:MAG: TIGR03435 family protein [Candidatus Korobacteraceae bacterium]